MRLTDPQSTAVDSRGNLYIAEFGSRIRKVSPGGSITTVAGGGTWFPYLADGQPATSALLDLGGGDPAAIGSVAVDGSGNLYIADTWMNRIRKVSQEGIITTIAGTGTPGYEGNNGPAAAAQLNAPQGVAVDGAGNLFIADTGNNRVRKVSADGMISTVPTTDGDGFLASVAVDGAGNLFVAAWRYVRKISPDGAASIVAGGGLLSGTARDGKPATQAAMYWLCGLAVDTTGNLFIVDCNDNQGVSKVTPDGILHVIQLPGGGSPRGVAVDRAGNAFFPKSDSDWDLSGGAERVYKVSPDGSVTPIAGTGIYGYSGDGGPATSAELAGPAGAAVDSAGNIYFADTGNGAIRILRPVQGK